MSKKVLFVLLPVLTIIGTIALYSYSQLPNQSKNENTNSVESPAAQNGPKISVTPSSYDFGTVKYNEGARYTFKINNEGNEPLEILRLSTSCGCTKATMNENDKAIPSGGSVDLFVSFDPSVHKDDSDLGEILRVVYIKSNDPEASETEVEIHANVVK